MREPSVIGKDLYQGASSARAKVRWDALPPEERAKRLARLSGNAAPGDSRANNQGLEQV